VLRKKLKKIIIMRRTILDRPKGDRTKRNVNCKYREKKNETELKLKHVSDKK
jgi:hypothetical protein